MDLGLATFLGLIIAAIISGIFLVVLELMRMSREEGNTRASDAKILLPSGVETRQRLLARVKWWHIAILLASAVLGALAGLFLGSRQSEGRVDETLTSSNLSISTATSRATDLPNQQPEASGSEAADADTIAPFESPESPPESLAAAICLSDSPIVFEDDFSDDPAQWVEAESIDYPYSLEEREIVDGLYRMSVSFKEEALTTSNIPYVNPNDFWVGFTGRVTESSEDGIIRIAISYRKDEEGNYYSARFGSDGKYSLYLRKDEFFTPIVDWKESDAFDISPGVTNQFSVIADGWTTTLCANGEVVDVVTDTSLNTKGRIGIGLSGEQGVTAIAEFDNVQVRQRP